MAHTVAGRITPPGREAARSMITYAEGGRRFHLRVAGIAIRDGRVLLHQAPADAFWAPPGGRAELMEFARDTLRRELAEEIGVPAEPGRLVWIVETFLERAGVEHHGVVFYFTMSLPDAAARQEQFPGAEDAMPLRFWWAPLAGLDGIRIEPSFLREGLRNLPAGTVHLCIDQRHSP